MNRSLKILMLLHAVEKTEYACKNLAAIFLFNIDALVQVSCADVREEA
jgi:hypothetical protein